MNEALAKQCAQHRANKTGNSYVAVRANNGQWMCESLQFFQHGLIHRGNEPKARRAYKGSEPHHIHNPEQKLNFKLCLGLVETYHYTTIQEVQAAISNYIIARDGSIPDFPITIRVERLS